MKIFFWEIKKVNDDESALKDRHQSEKNELKKVREKLLAYKQKLDNYKNSLLKKAEQISIKEKELIQRELILKQNINKLRNEIQHLSRQKQEFQNEVTKLQNQKEELNQEKLRFKSVKSNFIIELKKLEEEKNSFEKLREAYNNRQITSDDIIRVKQPDKRYIQVGLDFGTSSTKVMYKEHKQKKFNVINFDHKLKNYPDYCLPSICAIDPNGELVFGVSAARCLEDKAWNTGFQRLKVLVAGEADKSFHDSYTVETYEKYHKDIGISERISPKLLTTLYIAHAMRITRQKIMEQPEYQNTLLDIAFNICVPIDHIQQNNVKKLFEEIFIHAQCVESAWDSQKSFELLSLAEKIDPVITNDDQRVFPIPESVASTASYVISLRSKSGLHGFIDFGAGTTDISICNLVTGTINGAQNYWFAARNIPRGMNEIEKRIVKCISESEKSTNCTYGKIVQYIGTDMSKHNNNPLDEQIRQCIEEELRNLKESKDYKETWGKAYRNHLRGTDNWCHVNIYVSGGGANIPSIYNIFRDPWIPLQDESDRNVNVVYPVKKLPQPEEYDPGDCRAPFERMAVAYGLTIPKPQLEGYKLPSECPDHTPPSLKVYDFDPDEHYL